MPDYVGQLAQLTLSRTLWVVLIWPFGGLLWQALVARRRIVRARGRAAAAAAAAEARDISFATLSLTAASLLAHLLVLARLPPGRRILFESLARGPTFGLLQADLDLTLDPWAAALALSSCVVALCAAGVLAVRGREQAGWRAWTWLHLALAGALLSFLADGITLLAMGWALSAGAGAWLAGWNDSRPGVAAAAGGSVALSALLVGGALLFWGLGGAWVDGRFVPDVGPRFVAVRVGAGTGAGDGTGSTHAADAGLNPSESGRVAGGTINMTSMRGARVFLDEARTVSMQAPFVGASVKAGTHTFRVVSGPEARGIVVGPATFAHDEQFAIVPLGPVQSIRAISDQFAIRDRRGEALAKVAFARHAGPAGLALAATVITAWLIAAGALHMRRPALDAPRALAAVAYGATGAMLGPHLLARASFLFPLASHARGLVAGAGAAMLLAVVWRALAYADMRRWLSFSAGAPPALSCVALGTGGARAALQTALLVGVATAAIHLWLAGRAERVAAEAPANEEGLGDALWERAPARAGALLVSMDRWVIGAVAGAAATGASAAAWTLAQIDMHLVAAPADRMAAWLTRIGRGIESALGIALGRLAWALLALLSVTAVVALVHMSWHGR